MKKKKSEQCKWRCPLCLSQCSGVKGHKGKHQCPKHYKPEPISKKEALRQLDIKLGYKGVKIEKSNK